MIERTIFREEHHIFGNRSGASSIARSCRFMRSGKRTVLCHGNCGSRPAPKGCSAVPYPRHMRHGPRLFVRRGRVRGIVALRRQRSGFLIHTDLVATYLLSFGTEAQKRQWLPKMVSGEAIGSLGMTEPHAGSDLKAIRTRAVRDGDDFVINGQKVFISNGQLCDFVVLATKTDGSAGAKA